MKNLFTFTTALILLALNASATKHVITASGIQFSPNNIPNVVVGDTMRWVWQNGSHTTTSLTIPGGATSWDNALDNANQSFEYTVTMAGTYNYKCTPHASFGMTGVFTASSAVALCDTLNCDDSDACTLDDCNNLIGCIYASISCDDGDACTTDDCDSLSGCTNTAITCDDGDACTTDGCDPLSGCVSTPVLITLDISPSLDTINIGESVTLTANSNTSGLIYSWMPSQTLSCSNCPNPVASPLFITEYTVVVMDSNGCAISAGALIVVRSDTLNPNGVHEFSSNNIKIYPNPVGDILTIEGVHTTLLQLFISDVMGKRVYDSGKLNDPQHVIKTENMPSGVYLLQVKSASGQTTKKMLVGR